MARPKKSIDPVQVEKLGALALTMDEIADVLGTTRQLLWRRFRDALTRARGRYRMSIRRAQYVRAVRDGSDKMLIHLGRCELGQAYGRGPDEEEDPP